MRLLKIVLILTSLFIMAFASSTYAVDYTAAEVGKHNTETSCWLIINKEIFDVTSYIKAHPAPKAVMVKSCGKDVTEGFKTKKGLGESHSEKAMGIKGKLKIGNLKQ